MSCSLRRVKCLLATISCFSLLFTMFYLQANIKRRYTSTTHVEVRYDAMNASRVANGVETENNTNSLLSDIQINVVIQPSNLSSICGCPSCSHIEVSWTMVTFVKSAAKHSSFRELLRRTWASVRHVGGGRFCTMFVIGRTDAATQALLDKEIQQYDDIMQINTIDDYSAISATMRVGNPVVSVTAVRLNALYRGMQWSYENLDDDYFYSTCDDDMMLDMERLRDVIDENMRRRVLGSEFPMICMYKMATNYEPIRNKKNKNYISREQYQFDSWPRFCLGGMYTASVKLIKRLWQLAQTKEPWYNTDDVWITGILREELGIPTTMLVEPSPIAKHYDAFRYQQTERGRNFLVTQWEDLYDSLEQKKICIC